MSSNNVVVTHYSKNIKEKIIIYLQQQHVVPNISRRECMCVRACAHRSHEYVRTIIQLKTYVLVGGSGSVTRLPWLEGWAGVARKE